MSNKKSQGQLRRELLLLSIRHSINGRAVNCSGGIALDDDLKRLVHEGLVTLSRESRYSGGRTSLAIAKGRDKRISRYHLARPADGIFLTTWPACPCCGVVGETVWHIRHAINCSLRVDHRSDSQRNRYSARLTNLEPRRKQNRR